MEREQIFTVGDDTNHGVIKSFKIIDNSMYAYCTRGLFSLSELEKVKEPLFITEDNVKIYEDDKIWLLSTGTWIIHGMKVPPNLKSHPFEGVDKAFLYFSTEDAAKEYILMNKPLLSVNAINDYFEGWAHKPNEYVLERIKELAKQKLNGR